MKINVNKKFFVIIFALFSQYILGMEEREKPIKEEITQIDKNAHELISRIQLELITRIQKFIIGASNSLEEATESLKNSAKGILAAQGVNLLSKEYYEPVIALLKEKFKNSEILIAKKLELLQLASELRNKNVQEELHDHGITSQEIEEWKIKNEEKCKEKIASSFDVLRESIAKRKDRKAIIILIAFILSELDLDNIQDSRGNTALHLAVENHLGSVVKFLLKVGTNPNLENRNRENTLDIHLRLECNLGYNSSEIWYRYENEKVGKKLKEYGAKKRELKKN